MKVIQKFTLWFLTLIPFLGQLVSGETAPLSIFTIAPDEIELTWPVTEDSVMLQSGTNLGAWSLIFPEITCTGEQSRTQLQIENPHGFFRLIENPDDFLYFGNIMGFVMDIDHEPLPYAWVNDMEPADANGVITGDLPETNSDWILVYADGHLPTPVQPRVGEDGIGVFEAWMTPYYEIAFIEATGAVETLETDPSKPTGFSFTIETEQLNSTPALVGMADIESNNVAPRREPLDREGDYELIQAFALHACDISGSEIPLAAGAQLPVDIRDGGGTNPAPVAACFDIDTGTWEALGSNNCIRGEADHLSCMLSRFGLFGLFRVAEPLPAVSIAAMLMADTTADEESDLAADYKAALDELRDVLAQKAKEMEAFGVISDETMLRELETMADLAIAATSYANANQDESGKMHLLAAFKACAMLGYDDLKTALKEDLEDLTNELGEEIAKEGDCGRIREMLTMINQLAKLGGDPSIQTDLMDKIQAWASDCDLWTGSIRIWYFIDDQPLLGDQYSFTSGSRLWQEHLQIKLATHPGTYQVSGEITGSVRFPSVYYKTGHRCEMSINYYGMPQYNSVYLQFGGTYNGITFNLNDVTPGGTTVPMSVAQYYITSIEVEEDVCEMVDGYPFEVVFPNFYYSALVHGLGSSPFITIQEMFENGEHRQGQYETIRGSEEFTTGENAYAYPFTEGVIIWTFQHVKKVLPLEAPPPEN